MVDRFSAAAIAFAVVVVSAARSDDSENRRVQAIERGIAHLIQAQDSNGSWKTHQIGATALAGLTLLECNVPASSGPVQKTAEYLRKAWPEISDLHTTYCLALTILFFDRLGDPADETIIQALAVRLLAGQNAAGGWSYLCPQLSPDDLRQLRTLLHQQVELRARGELPKPAVRTGDDRGALPKEIRQVLGRLEAQKAPALTIAEDPSRIVGGDHSNTQFAILALWAARRHGIPVEKALARTAARLRGSQHPDGGWGYTKSLWNGPRYDGSTPSMTCAGLLGLAFGYGGAHEATLRTGVRPKSGKTGMASEPARDNAVRNGLAILSRAVGQPLEDPKPDSPAAGLGDMYYFLWSVERVAVAYGLSTIGGKDWYTWGSGVLLAAQRADGAWMGKFGTDADTCFALLFLRRANLAPDLTAYLKGASSVEFAIRTGNGQAAETGKSSTDEASPVAPGKSASALSDPKGKAEQGTSPQDTHAEAGAVRLKAQLLHASGPKQDELLEQLKQAKGVAYTDALAAAIPSLNGALKTKAREALAERLARMTASTLRSKLQDEAPEVRRAAALACAAKADRQLVPYLIALLEDRETIVTRGAHAALKSLTSEDFGPAIDAPPADRNQAVARWKQWWKNSAEGH